MFWELKERVRQAQLKKFEQLLLAEVPGGRRHPHHYVTLGWLDQKLDHFNHQANATFSQVELPNNSSADCFLFK